MMKKLMMSAAVSALMVSGAMAQSNPAPSTPPASPPAAAAPDQAPAMNAPDANKPAAATPDKPAADADKTASADKGKPTFVDSQKPDQWLASKFKGTDVVGDDSKKIGDVTDVLFDKNGKIEAFVIGVGGFLGIGSKEVALAPNSFDVVPGDNGGADKLKLSMNKDQLTKAQDFKPYEPPRPAATTGTGGGLGGGPRPSGGMGR
jgi:sporulation protein YlmC with PRC-barrel domain